MKYQAQYEVIDQDQPLSELGKEALRRITEDILRLGLVVDGPVSDPKLTDHDGMPWVLLEVEVREAGQLLESVGVRA